MSTPIRWRLRLEPGSKVCGRTPEYLYGCYFPTTDLNVAEHGGRGTGKPADVEWLDEPGIESRQILDDLVDAEVADGLYDKAVDKAVDAGSSLDIRPALAIHNGH